MPEFQFGTQRALDEPIDNLMADPVATSLVLGRGFSRVYPGREIMPRATVAWKFRIYAWDNKHLTLRDTHRPLNAPYQSDTFQASSVVKELRRYSWAHLRDKDELRIADNILNLQVKSGLWARRRVETDIERLRRTLLLTDGSYAAGNVITLASGDEFNAATGDSKATMEAAFDLIATKIGVPWNQLTVGLPYLSFTAAINDPLFIERRKYTTNRAATVEDLTAYWGCKRVWTFNERHADDTLALVDSWGDKTVVYFEGDPDLDTEFGEPVFARTFAWNQGIVSVPVDMPFPYSAKAFPYDDYAFPAILTPEAGVLIKNCNANA